MYKWFVVNHHGYESETFGLLQVNLNIKYYYSVELCGQIVMVIWTVIYQIGLWLDELVNKTE